MRQVLFVVAMLGAAFLGGALVNGPGLHWAQARLLDYMGLQDGGEITSITLAPGTSDTSSPQRGANAPSSSQSSPSTKPGPTESQPAKQAHQGPSGTTADRSTALTSATSNPPPLPVPAAIPEPGALAAAGRSKEPVANQPPVGGKSQEPPRLEAPGGSVKAENEAAVADGKLSAGSSLAPLDPSVGTALLASRSPSSVPAAGLEVSRTGGLSLEPAPASPPAPLPLGPAPSAATAAARPANTAVARQDWAAIRLKLQALGVTRYTLEGALSGRVVFSCLIPLVGNSQVVSQRFEGEGDDEVRAAQAAIRRIMLWKATRQTSGARQ